MIASQHHAGNGFFRLCLTGGLICTLLLLAACGGPKPPAYDTGATGQAAGQEGAQAAGGQSGIWGMGDHTRPLSAFDTTMHVPLLFRYPNHIAAGSRCDLLVSNYDFYPSILNYLGLEDQIPKEPASPGRNYAPVLRGRSLDTSWDDTVFYEFETVRAIRTDDWKYVERLKDGPRELYDLRNIQENCTT